jgi:hypothetical protein
MARYQQGRYLLSLKLKWKDNKEEFWYDMKRYKSRAGAEQAFKHFYAGFKDNIRNADILPEGKIRDTTDNSVSIIGID